MEWFATVAAFAAALFFVVATAPANAQSARTFVSGVGDDVNPCSRTAPCKTFNGAYAQTAVGGEINCLDAGDFGYILIEHSLTIICDTVQAGIRTNATPIQVNAGANDVVVLRGLDLDGQGGIGQGIYFYGGGALYVQKTTIRHFGGQGINFAPSTGSAAALFVTDVDIQNNAGNGILVHPSISLTVNATIERVRLMGNALAGFRLDSTGTSSPATYLQFATVSDSVATGNSGAGFAAYAQAGTETAYMTILHSVVSNNVIGLNANGAYGGITIGGSVLANNTKTVNISNGGYLASYGNNQVFRNLDSPTLATTPLQ